MVHEGAEGGLGEFIGVAAVPGEDGGDVVEEHSVFFAQVLDGCVHLLVHGHAS